MPPKKGSPEFGCPSDLAAEFNKNIHRNLDGLSSDQSQWDLAIPYPKPAYFVTSIVYILGGTCIHVSVTLGSKVVHVVLPLHVDCTL